MILTFYQIAYTSRTLLFWQEFACQTAGLGRLLLYFCGVGLATSTTIIHPLIIWKHHQQKVGVKSFSILKNQIWVYNHTRAHLWTYLAIHFFKSCTSSLFSRILYKCITFGPFRNFIHYNLNCQEKKSISSFLLHESIIYFDGWKKVKNTFNKFTESFKCSA